MQFFAGFNLLQRERSLFQPIPNALLLDGGSRTLAPEAMTKSLDLRTGSAFKKRVEAYGLRLMSGRSGRVSLWNNSEHRFHTGDFQPSVFS
jgi:hypothetical protein